MFIHITGPVREPGIRGAECHTGARTAAGTLPPGEPFLAWHWDGRSLTAQLDRHGLFPAFRAGHANEFVLADDLAEAVRATGECTPDPGAMALFFLLGYYVGEDTPLRDIRALPPGACLHWQDGRPSVSRADHKVPEQTADKPRLADRYAELFRTSVRNRLFGQPSILPLSGGRDSRHILLELVHAGAPPARLLTTQPTPPKGTDDLEVARQLSARTGIRHTVLPVTGSTLGRELEKNRDTHFLSDEHGWAVPFSRGLSRYGRRVYDGLGGDILSAGLYLNEGILAAFRRHDTAGVLQRLPGVSVLDQATGALGPGIRDAVDDARSRLEAEIARHFDQPDPVASFYFFNRTRREVALAPLGLLPPAVEVRFPYLDPPLVDFLLGIPAERKLDHDLHDLAIERAHPRFAGIRYAQKGTAATHRARHRRQLQRQWLPYLALHRGGDLVCRRYLVPRLLKSLLPVDRPDWLPLTRLINLHQAGDELLGLHELQGIRRSPHPRQPAGA